VIKQKQLGMDPVTSNQQSCDVVISTDGNISDLDYIEERQ